MKIQEIRPVVESINVVISNMKHYKEDIFTDTYEIDFEGSIIFNVDVETGISYTCINVGKFKFSTGRGFWKKCFREQVPTINRLCKKAVKDFYKTNRGLK